MKNQQYGFIKLFLLIIFLIFIGCQPNNEWSTFNGLLKFREINIKYQLKHPKGCLVVENGLVNGVTFKLSDDAIFWVNISYLVDTVEAVNSGIAFGLYDKNVISEQMETVNKLMGRESQLNKYDYFLIDGLNGVKFFSTSQKVDDYEANVSYRVVYSNCAVNLNGTAIGSSTKSAEINLNNYTKIFDKIVKSFVINKMNKDIDKSLTSGSAYNDIQNWDNGITSLYSTNGNPKANKFQYSINYPENWKNQESNEKNIIQKFAKTDVPYSIEYKVLIENSHEPVSSEDKDFKYGLYFWHTPTGLKLLSSSSTVYFNNKRTKIMEFKWIIPAAEPGQSALIKYVYAVSEIFDNYIAELSFSVLGTNDNPELLKQFKEYKGLFQRISNSFVFQPESRQGIITNDKPVNTKEKWFLLRDSIENFSILFPVPPVRQDKEINSEFGFLKGKGYFVNGPNMDFNLAYSVITAKYEGVDNFQEKQLNEFFNIRRDGAVENFNGEVILEEKIFLSKNEGRRYRILNKTII